jgi:2-polyprenyl-3-methyl-5-hydroxy-6-metoxy-1,4-benzoquinol methylase
MDFQEDYAQIQPKMYENESRIQKAKKVISVIRDSIGETKDKQLLDIGCSTGIMTGYYSNFFKNVDAIDIDTNAVEHASRTFKDANINFQITAVENFNPEYKYDVITCSHIYEHVPDSEVLFKQIYNLLKPGGVCYLAASNRYQIYENHYNLYFLSWFPKPISNIYLKIFRKGNFYYENHLSLFKLRKLTKDFETIDYTINIIKYPKKFFAQEMLKERTLKHIISVNISKVLYFFIPTYIWILKKPL